MSEMGQRRNTHCEQMFSASSPKGDIRLTGRHVREVPNSDIASAHSITSSTRRVVLSDMSFELIANDGNRLDFNKKVRVGEILGSNQHARRELAFEELTTNLNKLVPVRLVADHHGHRHKILKRPSGALQRSFNVAKRLAGLTRKICYLLAARRSRSAHTGEPHDAPALRHDSRAIRSLRVRRIKILRPLNSIPEESCERNGATK